MINQKTIRGSINCFTVIYYVLLIVCFAFFPQISRAAEEISIDKGKSIYLVAGSPLNRHMSAFPVVLLKLLPNGELERKRVVVTSGQGSIFVRPYYDQRILIVGSKALAGSYLLDIIGFDSVDIEKSFVIDTCPNCTYSAAHLLFGDNNQLFQIFLSGTQSENELSVHVNGVNISNGEQIELELNDFIHSVSFGLPGGNIDGGDSLYSIYRQGRSAVWGFQKQFNMGWELPVGFNPMEDETIIQYVNTESIRLISSVNSITNPNTPDAETILFSFNKETQSWSRFHLAGDFVRPRGFGHWITAEESFRGFEPGILENLSEEPVDYLPTIERFQYMNARLTGTLQFYNTIDEKLIVHEAGHPDSEVIFIEDNIVYFRVYDELRTGVLESETLDNIIVLLKTPEILNVHWAFVGRD
jgi:hypothetical protein